MSREEGPVNSVEGGGRGAQPDLERVSSRLKVVEHSKVGGGYLLVLCYRPVN